MTNDGGYMICGISQSSENGDVTDVNHGGWDIWLVKMNHQGVIQWDKLIGGVADDRAYNIIQTSSGGYVMAAFTESSQSGDVKGRNHGGRDYWFVNIDAAGNVQSFN